MIGDWKTFEKNNPAVVLDFLYTKEMEICPVYISKYNWTCENQIPLLMIPKGKGWHCLAVKKLPVLLRGINSKNNADFFVWIVFTLLEQKISIDVMKKYVKKIFLLISVPTKKR